MEWKIDEKEFQLPFMREKGYVRRQCKVCKSYFWTLDPDAEVCGEAPCVDYSFIFNPPTKRKYSVLEMRNTFLKFFERNGHEIIPPYPVVARWRDDLLITIASIADFQPFVTSGISSPPANPLVISQPCLRFEDIDKVGYTSGRHLTIFEMGGAHAFNDTRINDFKYWKDETIRYHHEFATEELGIPEDLITYKEHFWVGGGNAGPDVEGIIAGLEVSTLVFMRYRLLDNRLEDIPIWTVDTGYGIERWAWLSQGVPTGFEAIYGDVYTWIVDKLNINLDREILYKFTLHSPSLSDRDLAFFEDTLSKISLDVGEKKALIRLVQAGKLLDHSKASIFLIKDGAIPSNVREGYLTRMLLRRIFKIMEDLGLDMEFIYSLFDKQIELWSISFREIRDVYDNIFEVIDLEKSKYKKIRENTSRVISSYLKRGESPSLDLLIKLYDSHGIHPDYAREYIESRYGVKIRVPPNFTDLVSQRHGGRESGIKSEEPLPNIDVKTLKLYYRNQYQRVGYGKIVAKGDKWVVLDKTIFYPTGGGQLHDTGYIESMRDDGTRLRVYDVVESNGAIFHFVRGDLDKISVGDEVKLVIDWDRRYRLMRHHTATHILLSSLRRVLGSHVWQAGVVKDVNYAHLDITHYSIPSKEDLRKIEELCNKVISENRPVNVYYMDRGKAEKMYGAILYQGGVIPGKTLRIVEVENWDIEACGGTHVKRTGELSIFKIIGVERLQDGIIRLKYVAGDAAYEYLNKLYNIVEEASRKLSTSFDELPSAVEEFINKYNSLESRLKNLSAELSRERAKRIYMESPSVNDLKIVIDEFNDVEIAIKIGENLDDLTDKYIYVSLIKMGRGLNVLVRLGNDLIERGLSAEDIGRKIGKEIFEGFGGKGDKKYYRFGGKIKALLDSANLRDVVYGVIVENVKVGRN